MNSIISDLDEYKKTLKKGINSNTYFAILSIIAGILLIITGCAVAGIYFGGKSVNDYCWRSFYNGNAFSIFIINLLTEVAGIILIMIYRSNLKQAEYYRAELIVLRDLTIALEICETISDEDLNDTESIALVSSGAKSTIKRLSQKSKMQEQIIETLLQRCSN